MIFLPVFHRQRHDFAAAQADQRCPNARPPEEKVAENRLRCRRISTVIGYRRRTFWWQRALPVGADRDPAVTSHPGFGTTTARMRAQALIAYPAYRESASGAAASSYPIFSSSFLITLLLRYRAGQRGGFGRRQLFRAWCRLFISQRVRRGGFCLYSASVQHQRSLRHQSSLLLISVHTNR